MSRLGSIMTQLLITFPTYLILIRGLFTRLATAALANQPQEATYIGERRDESREQKLNGCL